MKHYFGLIVLLIFALSAHAQKDIQLHFNQKGEFKIVQFTDTHVDLPNKSNLNVYETVKKVLDIEKPDFAILTGDNVTQNDPQEGYRRFADIFKEAEVPWAAVFGNHDSQANVSREDLAEFIGGLPYCMKIQNRAQIKHFINALKWGGLVRSIFST